MNWEYKIKTSFHRAGMEKDWKKCTKEATEKLQRMRPNQFEYREIKAPEPTPSMALAKSEEELNAETIANFQDQSSDINGDEKKQKDTKKKAKKAKSKK